MLDLFIYKRRVQYHETDAMGVVHHANHIKFFEEARVAWLRQRGLMHCHAPYGPLVFAVVSTEAKYLRPMIFDDEFEVHTEAKGEGARICFRYAIYVQRLGKWVASGTTELVPLTQDFKPTVLPDDVKALLKRESWSESWPPSIPAKPL